MVTHAELAAAAVAILAIAAESLHAQRSRRLARLAFGPTMRPARWAGLAPALRVMALTALCWGLVTLLELPPKAHVAQAIPDKQRRHVLIVLDVSPSMRLKDAGPNADQSRMKRVSVVMDSFLERIPVELYLSASWRATTAPSRLWSTPKTSKWCGTSSATFPCTRRFRRERPTFSRAWRRPPGLPIPGSPGARSCSCSPTETRCRRRGCPRCPRRSPTC